MTQEDFKRDIFPLKDKIFRFAKRLLIIPAEAEDVTQDVFMKLWYRREDMWKVNSIEAFAITITKNICLDKLKSRKTSGDGLRQSQLPTEAKADSFDPEIMDQKAVIGNIINRLPEQQRIIIQLREIEGYEFEQIAEVTGISENTIRVNLSRARKTIKEEFNKIHEYGLKVD